MSETKTEVAWANQQAVPWEIDVTKNNAFVTIEIRGDIDVGEVISSLGIEPQSKWMRQARYRGSGPVVDFNGVLFEVATALRPSEGSLDALLKQTVPIVDAVRKSLDVISKFTHEVRFSVVVYGDPSSEIGWPEIRLPSSLIASLASIRSSIDIDLTS